MFKTAAVILVSDVILKGTEDKHMFETLLRELHSINYLVQKVSFLHENEKIITYELNILSKQFDVVIVIGNLSNDIVFKALANVTFQECTINSNFKATLTQLKEWSEHCLPIGVKLLTGNDLIYPIIQIQSIFIINDKYFENHLQLLRKRLNHYRLETKYYKVICMQQNGNTIQHLDKIKNGNLKITYKKNDTELSITLESTSFNDIVEIEKTIQQEFKNNFINSYTVNNMIENVYTDPDDQIRHAIEVIEKCLKDYGPDKVFLSFNGGKDCTVLLHLILTVMNVKYPNCKRPLVLYVKSEDAFPEQDKFISQCEIYFNLEVITVRQSIKEALNTILIMKSDLKACFMGTRRTDPFSSNLKPFQMTDNDWPQIMRVNPLLDWHYSDIWDYLLFYKVPYCELYDMGFTSLGNASNTSRNPSLLYNDIYLGTEVFLPAYKMLNESKERSGRNIH